MRRPWQVAVVFGASLAVLLAALGWATLKLLELDNAEQSARRQAREEETVRLALWRMDSALAPLLAEESMRPYFTYTAFYPTRRAYDAMLNDSMVCEVLLPSPLLVKPPPLTVVHFQIDAAGRVTSPQSPEGPMLALAGQEGYTAHDAARAAGSRLATLAPHLDRRALLAIVGGDTVNAEPRRAVWAPGEEWVQNVPQKAQALEQQQLNRNEYQARAQTYSNVTAQQGAERGPALASDIREGVLQPLWIDNVLLLVRRVHVNDTVLVQGCELDWPAIRELLRTTVRDLLPDADVRPIQVSGRGALAEEIGTGDRWLATLPIQLVPGNADGTAAEAPSPLRWSLVVGWVCVLLATTAVGTLLLGTLSLSERRAAFVSAVTHELRTPLTTFRMYTELLADGMVKDPAKQRQYFDVLNTEARRLGHLVENVLAYARLEGGRSGARLETVTAGQLFERVKPRLEQRTIQAGVPLSFNGSERELGSSLRVDVAAVEQILFNLVDNACKYAVPRGATSVRVEVGKSGSLAFLRVCDNGPGVPPREVRRLFEPFHKSAHDAAHSAPGVGLGLALCRRLARGMGGDLRLEAGSGVGAAFVLLVPGA